MTRDFPIVQTGPGDDCAVVSVANGNVLLTTDHLIEGRHFISPPGRDWAKTANFPMGCTRDGYLDLIARKAMARSVSDIAAMGGTPMCALATAALPLGFPHDAAAHLAERLHSWGKHWSCPVVGGDIAAFGAECPGPLTLTTTIMGRPHRQRGAVLRSGAWEGEAVYVTGALGNSFASAKHVLFEPRTIEAEWLCTIMPDRHMLTAMIDISDGLGRDGARLARASGVRIVLDAAHLPLAEGVSDWKRACADGEDYELLFTAHAHTEVPEACPLSGTRITRIGYVEPTGGTPHVGCFMKLPGGGLTDVSEMGYEHSSL